ncbi:MAG TPA: hypothetical protein VJ952_10640 [Opitutales bacterium]|nr:hypothetical protein [Opitutales bacterium]
MNVTLKIDDELCRKARHRAVDANLSLSKWVARLVEKEVERNKGLEDKTMAELLGADDGRGFEEFLPDRKSDSDRPIQFP